MRIFPSSCFVSDALTHNLIWTIPPTIDIVSVYSKRQSENKEETRKIKSLLFLKIDAESFNCFETQSDAKTFICSSHQRHNAHCPNKKNKNTGEKRAEGKGSRFVVGKQTCNSRRKKTSSSGKTTAFTVQDQLLLSLFPACIIPPNQKNKTNYWLHRWGAAQEKNTVQGQLLPHCAPAPWKIAVQDRLLPSPRKIPVQDQYCLHCLRRAAPEKNSSSGPLVLPSPGKIQDRLLPSLFAARSAQKKKQFSADYCLHCLRRAASKKK